MPTDEGFVPTPPPTAELLVMLTAVSGFSEGDKVLYPGAGTGNILAALRRYCSVRDQPCPDVVAYEPNEERFKALAERFKNSDAESVPISSEEEKQFLKAEYPPGTPAHERPVSHTIEFRQADYLRNPPSDSFDYVIANPPYLRYKAIPDKDREFYAERYAAASGQFDLYMPFVERMLVDVADDGWVGFISPRNFLFNSNAAKFRDRLRREKPHETQYLPTAVFPDHTVSAGITVAEPDPEFGQEGSFCISPFYAQELIRLLKRYGHSEEEIEDQLQDYQNICEEDSRRLRARRRREKENGGYNPHVDPYCEPEPQTKLGAY